ncbi:MAG: hypothetical protein FK732_06850 [Asgard group archaeon]|nr:hypothetical protein [Asgard group archaeon]
MKTVLMLTIARSGSSLLSGILQRLGVDMGSELDMKLGTHLNKFGSHENQEFIAFSVNILFEVGILLDFKKRLTDYEEEMQKAAERYRLKFRELIDKYSRDLWGFKEASLIFYLPYLYDEIENPLYIHLIRDYESTANSLLDMVTSKNWRPEYRDKIKFFTKRKRLKLYLRILRLLITGRKYRNTEFFMKVVANSHDRIKEFLKNTKHLTIHLNELTVNSEEVIHEIIKYLEIKPTKEQIQTAKDFIHPELLTK